MRKTIQILTLIFTTSLFAQYNLEFSQAINRHLDTGEELTVPEGKVWKIQDWMNGDEQGYGDPGTISIVSPAGEGTTYQGHWNGLHSKPLWVPAQYKVGGTNGQRTSINILEFSLVTASSSGGGGSGDSGSGGSGSGSSGSGTSTGTSFSDNAGVPGDDFTDQDGNTYGTTNINGMIWTTSNYEAATYSDGTPIPYISDWDQWKDATTGAYTYWTQDESLGYGKLYNIHAIRGRHDDDNSTPNKKFAPEGWHVPTTSEISYIRQLYYPGDQVVNSFYLKSQTEWLEGTGGNNISGLDIKPYPMLVSSATLGSSVNETYGFSDASYFEQWSNGGYIYLYGGGTGFWSSTPSNSQTLQSQTGLRITVSQQSDTVFYGSNSHFNFSYGNPYTHTGAYVRLIKDY